MNTKTVHKKTFTGEVVSNKMDKMVVVKIVEKYPHPLYKKILTKVKKIKATYEGKTPALNQIVVIESCIPVSKTCTFKVIK